MAPQQHDNENLLNGELARLLTEAGVPAKAERGAGDRLRMDVVTEVERLRVVLEAETGFGKKRQAIRDADARLGQGVTTLVFAVCYPDGATVDALADATLTWTLRTRAEGTNEARGRSNRIPQYPRFAIADIEATPVPDFRALGDGPRDALAAAFARLKDEPLAPFPRMDEDPVRHAIDEAVTEALGLDPEWVAGIRRELAREPSITNKRWAG